MVVQVCKVQVASGSTLRLLHKVCIFACSSTDHRYVVPSSSTPRQILPRHPLLPLGEQA